MPMVSMLKYGKAFAGMVAVAVGTATVAAPVVALPVSADPGGDSTASPSVDGVDAGTYESCSALFGLTDKSNANYVTFDVAGTADPLPGIGQGLTPVVTVTDPESGDVDECVPEIGFDDEASWVAFLDIDAVDEEELEGILEVVPYPGTPGYLIPISDDGVEPVAAPAELAPAPLSIALRIESDSTVNPAFTVTWDPSTLSFPELDIDDVFADIVQELGGPTSQLGIRFTEYVDEEGDDCPDPPEQIDVELAAALIGLTGVSASFIDEITTDTCDQIFIALIIRIFKLDVDSLGLAASVTVNAATPEPSPTPATPRFTG
jgi:hypothetical protein